MDNLKSGALSIDLEPDLTDGVIVAIWRGSAADRQASAVLDPFFARLLDRARKEKLRIEHRFDKLEHFNSSTIGALITFIQDARSLSVPLRLVYSQALKWQRLSFEAMRVFDKDDGLLEVSPR